MRRHETSDAPPRAVAFGLLGVFALIAVSGGLVLAMYAGFETARRPQPVSALARAPQVPPPPRLQPAPQRDLAAIRLAADARLRGYGWSDRTAGLAHIPIERAMQIQAARGWTAQAEGAH